MRGGLLRSVCQFQSERDTPDDIGGHTTTFRDEFIVRGWLRPERGREALEAGRLESSAYAVLTIRYDPGLAASIRTNWRVVIDGEYWQVVNINQAAFPHVGRTLELIVQKGTAQ